MPRMPEISQRQQLPEDQRHYFDLIAESRGGVATPYNILLHSPDLAARTANLVAYCRFETDFPLQLKELAICTVAREFDCPFEWAAHEGAARDAGVSDEAILVVRDRLDLHGLTGEESMIVSYVRQLLRPPHRVSEDTFSALKAHLGDARLVELTGIIGAYVGLACSLNAFEVPLPAGRPVLPT